MKGTRLLAVAALVGLIFFAACDAFGGGDNGIDDVLNATPGADGDDNVEPPEVALERWVQNRLNVGFVPDCEDARRPDDIGKQCAARRGERNGMLAFELGPAFSEYTRLIILKRVGDSWTIAHLENRDPDAPVPGIPWPLEVGVDVIVAGTGDCLRIRERPGFAAPELGCLDDGTIATVAEGPVSIDQFEWWRLEGYGWAASNWLRYPEDVPDLPTIRPDGEAAAP